MKLRLFALPPAVLIVAAMMRPSATVVEPPRARPKLELPVVVELPHQSEPKSEPPIIGEMASLPNNAQSRSVEYQVLRRVAYLLELTYVCMYHERYARAIDWCNEILLIDGNYVIALELRNLAARLSHGKFADAAILEILREYERETDDDGNPRIPFREGLWIPDAEAWSILSEIVPQGLQGGADPSPDEPDLAFIRLKLDTERYSADFENTKLEDILACIREASHLNILLDAAVRDRVDPDLLTSFHCTELPLKEVLQTFLAKFGLAYVLTEERVVLLTSPDRAAAFAAQN